MNKREVLAQAKGLRRTAENLIRMGQGSQAVPSIVRSAAEILIRQARSVDSRHPVIESLAVTPGTTWTEILAVAKTICDFTGHN